MISTLLLGVVLVIFLFVAIGPLESLSWWSEEGAEDALQTVAELRAEAAEQSGPSPYQHYVVYLSGIGAIGQDSIPPEELPLLQALREALPEYCIIDDVFPYSVENRGLTAQRPLAALWRWVEKSRFKNPEALVGLLVNARNAVQLFVSADRRYGPTYNIGTAQQIMKSLLNHGYRIGSGAPVTLVGWSGGAQIALGASWYLGMAELPLQVISIGGMMSDDYGIDRLQRLVHLRGTKDPLEKLGGILFAGRWPKAVGSPWSRALKEGRIRTYTLGPMQHNGTAHYFDPDTQADDGRSYLQVTTDAVIAVLQGREPAPEVAAATQ